MYAVVRDNAFFANNDNRLQYISERTWRLKLLAGKGNMNRHRYSSPRCIMHKPAWKPVLRRSDLKASQIVKKIEVECTTAQWNIRGRSILEIPVGLRQSNSVSVLIAVTR